MRNLISVLLKKLSPQEDVLAITLENRKTISVTCITEHVFATIMEP